MPNRRLPFRPCILIGAAWGALLGLALLEVLPPSLDIQPGVFAAVGATAMLVRGRRQLRRQLGKQACSSALSMAALFMLPPNPTRLPLHACRGLCFGPRSLWW